MAEQQSASWTLTARWILPVSGPPLAKGTVTVSGDTIVAVEPHSRRTPEVDLGNAAVIPGLVNAHTHLDLSGVSGRVPFDGDFTNWLRGVIAHRRSQEPEQVEAAVRAGLAKSLRHGVTLLGDISGGGLSWPILARASCRAVVFHELIGLPRDRADSALAAARRWLETIARSETCRPGLGPHAPYSVSDVLFAASAELARDVGLPLAVHVAETRAELELIKHRTGPFVPFLKELDVWDEFGLVHGLGTRPRDPGVLGTCDSRHAVFAHGNYLTADQVGSLKGTIVYCPRTHAYFRHPPHPFRDVLKRGVRVALGTDSLASNPDLDLLAEARFLHNLHPDVPGLTVLRMATLAGAEALGWGDVTGSIAAGKSADLVAAGLPDRDDPDPYRLLLESDLPGRRVLWRGRWRNGGEPAA
jgi:cytosine/adenosine deaminase-related metal-dependent hydrolase